MSADIKGDNQPYGLFEYAQLEALFPEGHPYRHSTIGSMADLDAASLETVRNWFRDNYGPNNAIVVLSGDIDEATARPLMQKYFGAIPRGPVNTPAQADVPTLSAPIVKTMHDRVANTRLTRSWAVPGMLDPDSVPLWRTQRAQQPLREARTPRSGGGRQLNVVNERGQRFQRASRSADGISMSR